MRIDACLLKLDIKSAIDRIIQIILSGKNDLLGGLPKKNRFFWEISPKYGWVGWLTPKQGPNPSKPPQIAPKIAFFDPNFTFRSPKSHKNPGVGGWVNRFGRDLPKKNVFFLAAPLIQLVIQ